MRYKDNKKELFLCVALRKSSAEVDAMRRQSKGLAQEYDRLLTEHHKLQVKHAQTPNHVLLLQKKPQPVK